jgi:DNA-binding CsgD family transcriptional regulator
MAQGGMRKQVLIFGLVGGVLVTLLQWTEFHFVVLEHSVAIYGALIAILFAGAGIWLGTRLLAPRERIVDRIVEIAVPAAPLPKFAADDTARERLGITRRELEILELVARGLSNREIGETLFVSENTVKTHCSRAFDKLGARRRTEAVQRSKELGLLP